MILPNVIVKDEERIIQWRGVLTDWELSKFVSTEGTLAKTPHGETRVRCNASQLLYL